MLHVRKIVASHVDGEKAMKERKFESLQKKIMKIKNAKREINERNVCEEKGERCLRRK